MATDNPRLKFDTRFTELKNIQNPHLGPWKDIRDYEAPNRGNFIEDKGKEGQRKDLKMYNGVPALSLRTLQAGMTAGITTPSRPWFKLAMQNEQLMERSDVRAYLQGVEKALYKIFNRSNFYTMASMLYLELGAFSTAVMSVVKDFDTVAHFDTYTIGEYWIATNHKKQANVLYRRIWKTVSQLIEEFGKENVSDNVLETAKTNPDKSVKVIHAVEPNDDRIPGMIDNKNMLYRSVYYEEETNDPKSPFLNVSGFPRFPYLIPRWSINGSDPYGTDSPGLMALGDSKQLQSGALEKARGVQLNMRPPLQAPNRLKNSRIMNVPGGVTFNDEFSGSNQGVRSLYENRVPLGDIIEDNREIEARIRSAYFVDLFLAIQANSRPQDMKAEVALQIDNERLLMLGPVLEGLNDDFLDPLIDIVFEMAEDAGVLPEAPEDLQGADLKVEYVSSLAKAQKLSTISNMERMVGLAGTTDQVIPGTIDKIDGDAFMDEAAKVLDIPSSIVRSDEDADKVRAAKAQAQAQKQAMEMGMAAAGAAKDLSQAEIGKGSVLDQLVGV